MRREPVKHDKGLIERLLAKADPIHTHKHTHIYTHIYTHTHQQHNCSPKPRI